MCYAVKMFSILVAFLCLLSIPSTSLAEKIRITADNVNIRAASNLNSRVMGQVSRDAVLEASVFGDEWIGVTPPGDILGWIRTDLLTNGIIAASRVNIRSGPGINYGIIANLQQGQTPAVHGSLGAWSSVSLPENTLVWVSRQFTEPLTSLNSNGIAEPEDNEFTLDQPEHSRPATAAKPPKPADPKKPLPAILSAAGATVSQDELLKASGVTSNMLVQAVDQGVEITRKGVLKKASILWRRPSRFVLVTTNEDDNDKPVFYVTGSDKQLQPLLNSTITVEGRQYVIQGSEIPLVIASRITIH